jgi:hypothetical protein
MEFVLGNQWVKVFQGSIGHVFFSKEDGDEDAPYANQIRFEAQDDIEAKIAFNFKDEDERDKYFDKMTAEGIQAAVDGIREKFFKDSGDSVDE